MISIYGLHSTLHTNQIVQGSSLCFWMNKINITQQTIDDNQTTLKCGMKDDWNDLKESHGKLCRLKDFSVLKRSPPGSSKQITTCSKEIKYLSGLKCANKAIKLDSIFKILWAFFSLLSKLFKSLDHSTGIVCREG